MGFTPREARRRRVLPVFITAAVALSTLSPLYAFFPTKLLTLFGMLGTSHEEITQDGVEDFNAIFFKIPETAPMALAIQEIADANALVDSNDTTKSAAHFDGENFTGGQDLITNGYLPRVTIALNLDDAATARDMLGRALHAVQDFYAHSNWVELGNDVPNGALGKPGMVIAPVASPTDPTCQNCVDPTIGCPDCSGDLITMNLTSGYFGGEDVVKPGPFKCSHGGVFDSSATGLFGHGINKDNSSLCLFTSHMNLHDKAADLATAATTGFMRVLARSHSHEQMELLLGAGPTLAMAIDTTVTTEPTLGTVQNRMIEMVSARQGTPDKPSRYVLVAFDDTHVEPAFVTGSGAQFIERIASLASTGKGGCPRPTHEAMLRALAAADKHGQLFVFSDAQSNDASLEGAVSSLAASKEVQVFGLSFGGCDAVDPSLGRVVQASGGQLFQLAAGEAAHASTVPDALTRASTVQLLAMNDGASATPRVVEFPVDSTVSALTITVAGTSAVAIARPDGSLVEANQTGVSLVPLSTGFVASVSEPPAGTWHVQLGASPAASIHVYGESPLDLRSFRFVKQGGRPGHEGFFPIPGLPETAGGNKATAAIAGEFQKVAFEMRSPSGAKLGALPMANGPGQPRNEFFGDVAPPDGSFLVYAVGVDGKGLPFQRVIARPLRAQPVGVSAPAPAPDEVAAGEKQSFAVRVTNSGPDGAFTFSAADDHAFFASASPSSFTLKTGQTVDVIVVLSPPANAIPGSTDTLTMTVENAADPSVRNFAVARVQVALPH